VYLVGLTGGIACGKSTVAERLAERGAEIVDADAVARQVVLPDTPTYHKIVEHFGAEVLDEDGFIDRPRLGRIIFADPAKRTLLNELTHPPIFAAIAEQLEVLQAFDGVVVLDVPLLVESGAARGYDAVVVVAAKPEVQLQRLLAERGMTEDDARARIAAQATLEERLAVATHTIWNEGTLTELRERTDALMDELSTAAAAKVAAEEDGIPND
jgi:dephospho-CoA kinase